MNNSLVDNGIISPMNLPYDSKYGGKVEKTICIQSLLFVMATRERIE